MQVTLAIEGNIGAGKSTLIRELERHFGEDVVEFIQEPVELWKNCNGANLLGAFYSDPVKYAYLLQTVVMISTLREQGRPQFKAIRIVERSALSNMCFTLNCLENGQMNEEEFAAYTYWYDFLSEMGKKPTAYIYLRTTPDTCFQRMAKRNRQEEVGVSMDYLNQLHRRHEDWFESMELPHVVIDGDRDFETDKEYQQEIIEKVKSLLK